MGKLPHQAVPDHQERQNFRKYIGVNMKKNFSLGLLLGISITVPLAIGGTYFIMNEIMETRGLVLSIEADEYIKKKNINRAIAKLNQSIGAHPKKHLTHLVLAEQYIKIGLKSLALEEYRLAKFLCKSCYPFLDEKMNKLEQDISVKKKD